MAPFFNDTDVRISKLTAISPTAYQKINDESFRLYLETDAVTRESLLEDLFSSLILDLYEMGIEFTCTPAELYDNHYTFDKLLDILQYIMPNTFYRKLKSDPIIKRVLFNILDGSGDEGDSTIVSYIKYLGLDDDKYSERFTEIAEFLVDKIRSTTTFDTYLKKMLSLNETDNDIPLNPDLLTYTKYVQELANKMDKILSHIQAAYPDLATYEILSKRISAYIQELLHPDKQNLYTWLFSPKLSDPEAQVSQQERLLHVKHMYELSVSSRLYPDYFITRSYPINILALIGCLVRIAAYASSDVAFKRSVTSMLEYLSSKNITLPISVSSALPLLLPVITPLLPSSDKVA